MAKVKLGNTPKNFPKSVEIVLLGGDVASIDISYVYRTRTQFAKLLDDRMKAVAEKEKAEADQVKAAADASHIAAEPSPTKSISQWFGEIDANSVEFVLQIADGWDLDNPFNEKSLLQLEDENPGALAAIANAYRGAVAEARTKN